MSLFRKIKRAFNSIARHPYWTAATLGFMIGGGLAIAGAILATPATLATLVAIGVYTTTALTLIATAAALIAVAIILALATFENTDSPESQLFAGLVGIAITELLFDIAGPLSSALAFTNPLTPLIILGVTVTALTSLIAVGWTAIGRYVFDMDDNQYGYQSDSDDEEEDNNDDILEEDSRLTHSSTSIISYFQAQRNNSAPVAQLPEESRSSAPAETFKSNTTAASNPYSFQAHSVDSSNNADVDPAPAYTETSIAPSAPSAPSL